MQLTIVSGASSGIGQAIAKHAEQDGHTVATISRRPGPGTFLEADLSDPGSWPAVNSWIGELVNAESWERVAFIHNAGVIDPVGFAGEADLDSYTSNVLLNGAAPVALGAGFIRAASKFGGKANLVLVSSGAGRRPITGWSSYCAGKAATDMWAQTVGLEQSHRQSNITVTSIAPGVVDTDMQAAIRGNDATDFPDIENFIALKADNSLRSADDVGRTLLALAQVDAGQNFGGMTIENGALLNIADLV